MRIVSFLSHNSPKEILQFPDKRLREVSKKVEAFNGETKKIVDELISVTQKVDAHWKLYLGMAAPQIGYNKRIVLVKDSYKKYRVMINPEIIGKKWLLPSFSMCYSVPGLYVVRKYYWVRVKYQDIKGNIKEEILKGGKALALQQEIDHINGKLICDL